MVIGGIHIFSGGLLALTSGRIWVFLLMLGSVLLAIDYFVVMVISRGEPPSPNLMTVTILSMPALVIYRGLVFVRMRKP
jgi:hypothetical protein